MKLADDIRKAGRVFLCGNGGSAANALHIANDLLACGVKAQALTADVATLTAIANDFGYSEVFAVQLDVLAERGDLLIALSGSGKSPNILRALVRAREKGVASVAIVGAWQDKEPPACTLAGRSIRAGQDMQNAEQQQLYLGHQAMKELKRDGI